MQTIQQLRARSALSRVQAVIDDQQIDEQEFKQCAKALPTMIHRCGLGQAAAFCRSKQYKSSGHNQQEEQTKTTAYKILYDLLQDWLTDNKQPYGNYDDLLQGITSEPMEQYRLANTEALLLMGWVKRFAEAFIPDPPKAEEPRA